MRLYPIELRSLEQLQAEKARLKKAMSEQGDLSFNIGDLVPNMGKGDERAEKEEIADDDAGMAGMLQGLLSSDLVGSLAEFLPGVLTDLLKTKVFKKVTGSLLSGYLKWKAVELGFDLVKHFVKSKKEDKKKGEK